MPSPQGPANDSKLSSDVSLPPRLFCCMQVQVAAGADPVSVQHLELSGDVWTAEVDGRRLKGSALLFTHAGEQVLTVWQDGKAYEFRSVPEG